MNRVKAILMTIIIVINAVMLTGCGGKEPNEIAYIVALGIDLGENENYDITIQYANTTQISGGGSEEGGKSGSEIVENLIVESPNIYSAVGLANQIVSKTFSLSHAKIIVFGKDVAKKGLNDIMEAIIRSEEIRPDVYLAVAEEKASKYLLEIKPTMEVNPAKYYQLVYNQNNMGIPNGYAKEFYFGLESHDYDSLLPYAGVAESSMQSSESEQSGGSQEQGGSSQEQSGGSQEQSGGSQEQSGGDSQEQGGGLQEQSGGSQEQSGGSQEQSGGSQEQSGGSQEQSGGSQEQSGGSQEQSGGDSQEQGGGLQEQSGGSQEKSGGSQEQGGGSQEQSGGSQEQSGSSQEQGSESSGSSMEGENKKQKEAPVNEEKFEYKVKNYKAGETLLEQKNKSEAMGSAVFKDDKMIGTLGSVETEMYKMLVGEYRNSFITLFSEKTPDSPVTVKTMQRKKPNYKIDIENKKIDIKLFIEGDIYSLPADYNIEENINAFEDESKKYIEEACKTFMENFIKEYDCDIFRLSEKTKKKFLTIQEHEEYKKDSDYKDFEININVNFNIRRTGLVVREGEK